MNKQTSKLLSVLLNSPGHSFRYEELAVFFNVSTRSIRNYIQGIIDFLNGQHMREVLHVSEGSVAYVGGPENNSILLQAVVDNDFYLYRLSPEERAHIILLYLLMSDGYRTIYELSEKFNVSRTTILKDMEQVKEVMSRHRLSLDPSIYKGYLLCVEEYHRREMIVRIVQAFKGASLSPWIEVNVYERFLYEEWELAQYTPFIRTLLLETERQHGLDVSDASFEELLLMLSIITYRLVQTRYIPEAASDVRTFQGLAVHTLAQGLLNRLSAEYGFRPACQETEFLASRLYYCRFYSGSTAKNARDIRLHMALTDFLRKVGASLSIPVYDDLATVNMLENHLKGIDKYHQKKGSPEKNYANEMLLRYREYYKVVIRYLPILEENLGYSYSPDDIAVLTLHIAAAVERCCKNDLLPRLIVVCHTGLEAANFLAERLTENFNIMIVAITSAHKLSGIIQYCDYDLIVSTITLDIPHSLWVRVSPMLEDEDVLRLQQLFIDIKNSRNRYGKRGIL